MGCMSMTENEVCEKCGWPDGRSNEPHQLPVGYVLHGQYRVGRVLGQGGFGITYLGWDDFLEIPVAIKEFYPNSMVNREVSLTTKVHCYTENVTPQYVMSKERFLREAKALARFEDEPAIVRIRNFFQENETAYIVMEYVRGTNLAAYVNMRGGKLSPKETFTILRPIMEALDTVHKSDLVHRDISPDNIMLHPRGGAKLLDFGAVRSVESAQPGKDMQRSTEAILKHGFAPMEQYQTRGNLGPWSDEYALCATVYYCLTGRIPEEAPRRMLEEIEIDWNIPGLTERQKAALAKGMSLRSRDRYATVGELITELYTDGEEAAMPVQPVAASRQTAVYAPMPAPSGVQMPPPSAAQRPQPSGVAQPPAPPVAPLPAHSAPAAKEKKKRKPKTGVILGAVGAVLVVAAIVTFLLLPRGWVKKNGTYYYYDNGFKLTDSWLREGDNYYYFTSNGMMFTSWKWIDGNYYYFGKDGIMVRGWLSLDDERYYLGEDGVRVTGVREIDGAVYRFSDKGKLYTGWQKIDGDTYFFGTDGAMRVGLHKLSSGSYYFDPDGRMLTGWQKIGEKTHYFDKDGAMHVGWLTLGDKKYYFDVEGKMLTGTQYIGGHWYHFDYYGQLTDR